jgi:hypothetical protein
MRTQSQLWRIIISAIATPQVQISPDHPFKLLIKLAYRPAVKRRLAQVPGLTRKCALDLILRCWISECELAEQSAQSRQPL